MINMVLFLKGLQAYNVLLKIVSQTIFTKINSPWQYFQSFVYSIVLAIKWRIQKFQNLWRGILGIRG